ncbi:dispanin subfamily A member 2b-like [Eleutherodactylus coqui]|uniref:dispanin subfamily A member 2b-like n=1 Tax=Eleutherodactylus coqui TaxID=57060 RepID=UPI003463295E
MENLNCGPQFTAPPPYEHVKEEMEFRNCPAQTMQSTVVTITPDGPPVRDHLIWSTFNTVYFNFCCLGFLAFVFSVKSRDRKLHGDKHGAVNYASTARSLNIAATVVSILVLLIIFVSDFRLIAHYF